MVVDHGMDLHLKRYPLVQVNLMSSIFIIKPLLSVPKPTSFSIHFDNTWNDPQNSLILPYQSHMAGKLREIDRKKINLDLYLPGTIICKNKLLVLSL
jgi:hypothetical protein